MKKLFLLLFVFIITGSINAQTKAEIFAKENTEKLSEILGLTETENVQVYYILVEKENEFNLLRNKYKGDKDTLRLEIEKLNPIYNKMVKDVIGQEKMIKYLRNGIGIAANGGFIPYGLPGYSRNKNNEYDMSKAKKLVNEYKKKYNERNSFF